MPENVKFSELLPINYWDGTTYIPVVIGPSGSEVNRKMPVSVLGNVSGSTGSTTYFAGDGIEILNDVISVDDTISRTGHTHSQYLTAYTETNPGVYTSGQTDQLLLGKSNTGHTHSQYLTDYTETDPVYQSEKSGLALKSDLNGYALSGHSHSYTGLTDLPDIQGMIDSSVSGITGGTTVYNGGFGINITGTTIATDNEELGGIFVDYTTLNTILEGYQPVSSTQYQVEIWQGTGVTVYSSGWTSGTTYEYVLTEQYLRNYFTSVGIFMPYNILSTTMVDIIPDISTYEIVKTAEMYPQTTTSNGSVKLYSKYNPSGNIKVTIRIISK